MSRKITRLKISNVMRINEVDIRPKGNIVIIGGRNAQGKTSLIDCIPMAIGGRRNRPAMPLKVGEDEGFIHLEIGEFDINLEFKRSDSDPDDVREKLTVRDASGAILKSPQAILDPLAGPLAFDPLEFADMTKHRQAETLRELVGLDVEQLEVERDQVYALRTEKGQEKRAAEAVVADMAWYEEVPELRSITEISSRMRAAVDAAKAREEKIGTARQCERDVEGISEEIRRAENIIANEQAKLGELLEEKRDCVRASMEADADVATATVPDLDPIQAELEDTEDFNTDIRMQQTANERRESRVAHSETVAAKWKELDTRHARIVDDIRTRTEAVEYPIDGLDLRHEGVYYQGVPFAQGSRAERIKVSLAMAMALNDKTGVLLIRDGSVLDDESMKLITGLAVEHDFMFFIEMARGYKDQPGAIVIEDGAVKSC